MIFLLPDISLRAQYYFYNEEYLSGDVLMEAGCSAGMINSLTDIGGRKGVGKRFVKDLSWSTTKAAYSAYMAATYRTVVGVRLEVMTGNIGSHDALLRRKDPLLSGRYGRNLSFQSSIMEIQFATELHPLFFKKYDADEAPVLSPYFVLGLGYFSFNPRSQLNGQWYDLHPLRLEGQGFEEYPERQPYKLKQFNVPLGAGLRYELHPLLCIRIEIIHRKLFTDYLDDVSNTYIDPIFFANYMPPDQSAIARQLHSRMQDLQPGYNTVTGMQRGNNKNNDAYFTIQLKLGIMFRSKE
jgi:hypothetical protein